MTKDPNTDNAIHTIKIEIIYNNHILSSLIQAVTPAICNFGLDDSAPLSEKLVNLLALA